jgi:hypothetical protein
LNLASWLKSPIGRLASLAIPGAAALSVIGLAGGSLHSVSPDTGTVALDAPFSKMALKLTTDFDAEQLSRTLGQDVSGISSLGGNWVRVEFSDGLDAIDLEDVFKRAAASSQIIGLIYDAYEPQQVELGESSADSLSASALAQVNLRIQRKMTPTAMDRTRKWTLTSTAMASRMRPTRTQWCQTNLKTS